QSQRSTDTAVHSGAKRKMLEAVLAREVDFQWLLKDFGIQSEEWCGKKYLFSRFHRHSQILHIRSDHARIVDYRKAAQQLIGSPGNDRRLAREALAMLRISSEKQHHPAQNGSDG